ncbi:unnamed protein product, partial [Allacma fusca]
MNTDSMSIAGGDIERFWPRLSFDMTACQDIHEVGMCHGLCKNLVSLSQMSLNHQTTNGEGGHGSPNDENQMLRNGEIVPPLRQKDIEGSVSSEAKNNKQVIKSPCKPTSMGLPLPALSDESIFKIPKSPLSGSTITGSHRNKSKAKDQSDAEQETISIPPMKLLDLTPIRNNGSHPMGLETTSGSNANHSENSCENGRENPMSCVSPGNNVQSKGHRGCDHNHHFTNGNVS